MIITKGVEGLISAIVVPVRVTTMTGLLLMQMTLSSSLYMTGS